MRVCSAAETMLPLLTGAQVFVCRKKKKKLGFGVKGATPTASLALGLFGPWAVAVVLQMNLQRPGSCCFWLQKSPG